MQTMLDIIHFMAVNGPVIIQFVVDMCIALIGIFILVPGPQPEKALGEFVVFISQFSRKPTALPAPKDPEKP